MPNLIESIIAKSENNIVWLIDKYKPQTLHELLVIADTLSKEHTAPLLPYFASRDLTIQSPLADYFVRRLIRRNLVRTCPLELTYRGKKIKYESPSFSNDRQEATINLPFTSLPPDEFYFGTKKVPIKPLLDESEVILCTLLPLDPAFFFVFSHYHSIAMRTAYPLLIQGNTFLALDTGDLRNITTFPSIDLLNEAHQSYTDYLKKYCPDFTRYIEMVVNLLLSIGTIHFSHLCNQQLKTLNRLDDRLHLLLDFAPKCYECNMAEGQYLNLISIRHTLVRAWEKGVLAELYFSKLISALAHKLDSSVEVYPRLQIKGLTHECDTFVRRGNNIILFELKRSTVVDRFFNDGITQLKNNKRVLESWGLNCKTVLVTNVESQLPATLDIDCHLAPKDFKDIPSILESLLS
jgi:hypothetical protein